MKAEPRYATRLQPGQRAEIDKIAKLRSEAAALRATVANGAYGDVELTEFWRLLGTAGLTLRASNSELADRVGLRPEYFTSVVRDSRSPKLQNFLKALAAIIDVANERLADVEIKAENSNIIDNKNAYWLANHFSNLAHAELELVESQIANSDEGSIERERYLEILQIFADGFEQIVRALETSLGSGRETTAFRTILQHVGQKVDKWWAEYGVEVVDWSVRIPFLAAGTAFLSSAGAYMPVATVAISALVGGDKVAKAVASRARKPSGSK